MDLTLPLSIQPLERTPRVLRAMLAGLDEAWIRTNYGPDTFSPFDVVGHLIHGEKTDWMPRARHILEHGESVPFAPFDRYAMYEASRGKSIGELLDEFAALRAGNLAGLAALRLAPDDLARTGMHPALGRVSLGQLLAAWVVHDLHHIAQIARCMAIQLREACGPWEEYMSIVRR